MSMNPIATLTNRKMTLDIKGLPARLGRNNNVVEVYLFHESVSREHCLFECINRRFTVRDLGSTVGTFINGVRLEPNIPYNIDDGAKIQFGKVKMVFHADYQALAEWERMQAAPAAQDFGGFAPAASQGYGGSAPFGGQSFSGSAQAASQAYGGSAPAAQNFGGSAPAAPGNKNVKVSVREMNEYEYDEDEVVYIECGLKPEEKSLSYTSELRKKELEAAIANEADQADWKSTQVLSADESEALAAAVEAASETQVGEPFEAPAEEPAEEIEAAIASEESQPDWKSTQVLSADESEALEAAVEAADEDLVGSVFADEGTFKIEDQQDEEHATKTLVLTWIDDITGETKKLKIDHFPFAIGRKSDVNDYTEVYVYDEASTNGVRLNGEKITPETQVKLRSGDHIRVLDITFVVTID